MLVQELDFQWHTTTHCCVTFQEILYVTLVAYCHLVAQEILTDPIGNIPRRQFQFIQCFLEVEIFEYFFNLVV